MGTFIKMGHSYSGPSGQLDDSVRFYQEALGLARQAGDQEAVDKIQEGLKEVKKKREQGTKEEQDAAEGLTVSGCPKADWRVQHDSDPLAFHRTSSHCCCLCPQRMNPPINTRALYYVAGFVVIGVTSGLIPPWSSSDELLKDLDSPQRINLCQLLEPNRTSLTRKVLPVPQTASASLVSCSLWLMHRNSIYI